MTQTTIISSSVGYSLKVTGIDSNGDGTLKSVDEVLLKTPEEETYKSFVTLLSPVDENLGEITSIQQPSFSGPFDGESALEGTIDLTFSSGLLTLDLTIFQQIDRWQEGDITNSQDYGWVIHISRRASDDFSPGSKLQYIDGGKAREVLRLPIQEEMFVTGYTEGSELPRFVYSFADPFPIYYV